METSLAFEPKMKINDRLFFFDYRGEDIMWCDYSKSGEAQMIELFDKAFETSKTVGSSVKILANFKSTPKSPTLTKRMRENGKWFKLNGVEVKIGIIGVDNSFNRVVINTAITISRIKNIHLFESKEEALKWLST